MDAGQGMLSRRTLSFSDDCGVTIVGALPTSVDRRQASPYGREDDVRQRKGFSDGATDANSETLLRLIESVGLLRSDDGAKTKEGANSGDKRSPSGDNCATNLPQSQTSTSCLSVSCLAALMAAASSG
jgi:hypothetical protein